MLYNGNSIYNTYKHAKSSYSIYCILLALNEDMYDKSCIPNTIILLLLHYSLHNLTLVMLQILYYTNV